MKRIPKSQQICRNKPCWCGKHEPHPEPDLEIAKKNQEWVDRRKKEREKK